MSQGIQPGSNGWYVTQPQPGSIAASADAMQKKSDGDKIGPTIGIVLGTALGVGLIGAIADHYLDKNALERFDTEKLLPRFQTIEKALHDREQPVAGGFLCELPKSDTAGLTDEAIWKKVEAQCAYLKGTADVDHLKAFLELPTTEKAERTRKLPDGSTVVHVGAGKPDAPFWKYIADRCLRR